MADEVALSVGFCQRAFRQDIENGDDTVQVITVDVKNDDRAHGGDVYELVLNDSEYAVRVKLEPAVSEELLENGVEVFDILKVRETRVEQVGNRRTVTVLRAVFVQRLLFRIGNPVLLGARSVRREPVQLFPVRGSRQDIGPSSVPPIDYVPVDDQQHVSISDIGPNTKSVSMSLRLIDRKIHVGGVSTTVWVDDTVLSIRFPLEGTVGSFSDAIQTVPLRNLPVGCMFRIHTVYGTNSPPYYGLPAGTQIRFKWNSTFTLLPDNPNVPRLSPVYDPYAGGSIRTVHDVLRIGVGYEPRMSGGKVSHTVGSESSWGRFVSEVWCNVCPWGHVFTVDVTDASGTMHVTVFNHAGKDLFAAEATDIKELRVTDVIGYNAKIDELERRRYRFKCKIYPSGMVVWSV
ncbi:hypothetical protein CALCODRAFT_505921 [Calocera cornea HHB12733]|uniref:Replication factor A C-terminal domain-containing protein n=1 Tax=Calocera cornea HHB12733 TaxID=1353952 RepID=A0A165JGU5_9BASI|nr:hypothetical protein CALCODRAFT_505921 [Calocera cornea HHB12733]